MDLPEEDLGPKMQLLNERQRKFAWAMALGGCSATEAAREAGYSDHDSAARVSGWRLMQNRPVVEAIEEAGALVLRGLASDAVRAARAILHNPKHKAHARMIEVVLDRVYPAKTEHKVSVEHKADLGELEALARRLAAEAGVNPERLLGNGGGKMKTIEATVLPIGGNDSTGTHRQTDRQGAGGQAEVDDALPF